MAKCTVEPKLDFDKFTEACERFKEICERELGDACAYINDEVYPVILKEMETVTKNDEPIILRPNTFMKPEDFEITKEVWEKEIPNSIVIPYTMDMLNRKREWIPTSLCLPEEGKPVLVTVKIWPDEHGYHYTTSIDVHDHNGWRDNGNNVVAWQPLPAPYKGE